jgi:transglutaminase-like putative cysteine protease
MASMLRSLGIPTKLTTGYTPNAKTYHAWNEVYIQSLNRWLIIDSTYDAEMRNRGLKVNMFKDQKDYRTEKEF